GLQQVPGDGLAFAVLIGGEVEGVGLLEGLLQLRDGLLLVGADDVVGVDAVLDVDAAAPVGALLHLGGPVTAPRAVPDVPDRGADVVLRAEVSADGPGFRRGLDDDQMPSACHVAVSFLAAPSRGLSAVAECRGPG